jgi:alpha-beta hydrolase superfamily lysophospholipase
MMPAEIRRIEDSFEAARGKKLFRRAWLPAMAADCVIVVIHGFGEHCGRYEALGSWFARRGAAVHAYDQRGHGRTPGKRGHADSFELLLDDLEVFIAFARAQHPAAPLVLLGHSMGGLVVSALASGREPDIDLLVTSGAALTLSPDISRLKLWLAGAFRRLAPRLAMQAGLDLDGLSRDPEVRRRYEADPLVHGQMTAALAAGMLDAQQAASGAAARVAVPMLLLHGEADPLCPVSGSQTFHARLSPERTPGSALRIYPELLHEIFNEPEGEAIFEDVRRWLLERLGRAEERSATGVSVSV